MEMFEEFEDGGFALNNVINPSPFIDETSFVASLFDLKVFETALT